MTMADPSSLAPEVCSKRYALIAEGMVPLILSHLPTVASWLDQNCGCRLPDVTQGSWTKITPRPNPCDRKQLQLHSAMLAAQPRLNSDDSGRQCVGDR
jgi:hypothetical protein